MALAAVAVLASSAWAGPTGGSISAGSGSISQQGGTTTVTQGSQNLAINWNSFSIGAGENVNFIQPNSSAIALNRVTGRESSVINGALTANGQVWILNANGVLFGKTASVNVGGLVASTLSLSDADFMAGKTSLRGDGSQGSVVNQGSLAGGYVALLGKQVRNSGTITTGGGTTALAAGDAITLSFSGSTLLSVQVDAGTYDALAENSGLIQADDGTVLLSASAKDALLDTVINNTGVIQARGIGSDGGRIVLLGGSDGGTVNVAGTLDASSSAHDGGFIETSGAHVKIADGASISTLSASGRTGTWLVDPTDFTISSGSASQTDSGIGADTLSTLLASNNVTLETASSGSDSGDIMVNAAVSWSANTTLTLTAAHDIDINAAITATGSSAGLALNYGGDYKVSAPVTLSGANASFSLNGQDYALIHSMSQLDALDGASGYYALAQDLDASGTTYSNSVVSGTFSGTFAGLGHTVSNLVVSAGSTSRVGLFATSTGTIRDLGLLGGSVTSTGDRVGSLVGYNFGGTLYNVFSSADVSGGNVDIGGLVGFNTGSITEAYASGSVTGGSSVGGLVGYSSGTLSKVYGSGDVTGSGYNVGGLVGYHFAGTIVDAYATGDVTADGGSAGGLIGRNTDGSTVSSAYASGTVASADSNAGGLVGYNYNSTVSNSYWDSSTTGQSSAYGTNSGGSFSNVGAVTSSTAYNHGSYASFGTWTETRSGSGVWVANDGSGNTWVMIEGSTRPFLYSEYSSTIRNAHQLQLMALDTSASYSLANDIDASETDGSDTSGMWTSRGFSPVGTGESDLRFSGSLDGQGHAISSLSIARSGSSYVGLFGGTAETAAIDDVALVDASIVGGDYVGGLVGYNWASITDSSVTGSVSGSSLVGGLVGKNYAAIGSSYAEGSVTGQYHVGGLVGYNNDTGRMTSVYSTASVSGDINVGGVLGYNDGVLQDAYASGAVSGSSRVGGILGNNSGIGRLINSYATGSVSGSSYVGGLVGWNNGRVTSSFWLLSNTSVGVAYNDDPSTAIVDSLTRGLGASDMTSASTFVAAGWDVATNGGSDSIWRIYDGYTTPLLRSFMTTLTVVTGDVSKTYDGTTSLSGTGYSYGDTSADTSLIYGTAVTSSSTSSKNVGDYTISTSGLYSGQQGYDLQFVDGTATITAATLTLSGTTTAASKVYDGTTTATVSGGSLSGVITGDSVTLTQSGSFTDKNAGTGKTVSYTGTLSGDDAGNYVLSGSGAGTTTATITAKAITGAIVADGKVYDGTTAATTSGTLSGVIDGDSVTLTTSGSFADKNAGIGKTVTVSGGLSGSDAGNYTLSTNVSTTATITAKTITGAIVADGKVYDGTTAAATSGTLSGVIDGDSVTLATSGAFADKNAGVGKTVTVSGSLSGSDAGNYTLSSSNTTTTATITAKAITGAIVADGKVYDGTTAATTSGTLSGVIDGDSVTLATSGSFADKNAGVGKTVTVSGGLSGSDAGNYTLSSNTTTTATITAKAISGTIVADGKVYDGTTVATTSGTLSGVIDGDSVTLATSGSFADKNAGVGKTVTVSGGLSGSDAGNYTLSSNTTTTATITAKAISGTIVADGKVYDGTTSATTSGTLSGVIEGDSVTLATSGSFADKNAGAGKTVTVSGSLSGSDAGNYTLSSNASTTATISQASLTITANDAQKTVDGQPYVGGNGITVSGLVGGDTTGALDGNLIYGGSSQGATAAGSYTIAASGLSSGNYSIRYVDGVLTIESAAPTALSEAQQRTVQQNAAPQADATRASTERVSRETDGSLQFSNSGRRLLRIANGGVAVPAAN